MGYKVQVYIYDLTQGMARSLGPALLGRPLDGVWHTAIVVYGKEYFFGGSGIQWCGPGGTVMGQPGSVEDLGETDIPESVFQDYLSNQGRDRFRGDKYDLFHHNCNNFSNETAQFLVGRGIPQHIIDLPGEILRTPMGQMLAPMLQQMTPTGTSIPFTDMSGTQTMSAASPSTSSSTTSSDNIKFPVNDSIKFDQPLKVEGLGKKLKEFNLNQDETTKLSESEVGVILGIAKGLVRLSDENFSILMKISKWKTSEIFPLLDILRFKCVKNSFDNKNQVQQVVQLFEKNLNPDYTVNSMLAVRGLVNMIQNPEWRILIKDDIITKMLELLPTEHSNLEISISSYLVTISILQQNIKSLDTCILIVSSLVLQVLPMVKEDEALYRCLVTLGNIIHCGQEEVIQFLLSLEAKDLIMQYKSKGSKVSSCSTAILRMLTKGSGSSGLDLD